MQLSKSADAHGGFGNLRDRLSSQERRNLLCPLSRTCEQECGGPERDRTADLLRAKQALSQLSYRPVVLHNTIATGSGLEVLYKEQNFMR